MACILNIETSTSVCSVAVSNNGVCEFEREDNSGPNHAVSLGKFVDEALSFIDSRLFTLDAVAISEGPGSYTGLRIGTSMAKGICYAREVPLVAVSTLKVMSVPLLLGEKVGADSLLCPMIDARRMEVYAALYDRALNEVRPTQADIVDADTYRQWLDRQEVCFFGNGSEKCKDAIGHPNARFIDGIKPLARWMFPLAEQKLMNGKTEDVAYFTPFYLKDFVAKQPRKLL